MKIAVNTRFLLEDYLEGYGHFLFETIRQMALDHPEHEFLFIFDRPFNQKFIPSDNCKGIVAGPAARHPILWKWWFDVRIPAILRRYKADVFLSCDGFCSLRTHVPQCLVIHDLAFLHFPGFIKRSHLLFYKRYTPKFLKKAAVISTVSAFSKNDIVNNYGIDPAEVEIVNNAARNIFHPIDFSEMQEVRDQFTEGKNYFIYTGSIHPRKNLINLLKAFSIFKKRQKSDWKLVIAGRLAWKFESFTESLKKYKYRSDVVMTGYVGEEELSRLIGAAYAMVYPSLWEGFGMPVLEAMQSAVPVITSEKSAMEEIGGDAALYANVTEPQELAERMMLLYKDETLRNTLIKRGKEKAKNYSWVKTADLLWKSVLKAAETTSGS